MDAVPVIFTIGHSNHTLERFIELLRQHRIDVLVDVRSNPYSQYTTHCNTDQLRPAVAAQKIKYLFLGQQVGGRPEGAEFYDPEGHVLYSKVAQTPAFLAGIDRLVGGAGKCRLALMCSEEDPAGCHRRLLIGRVLKERGLAVEHIRGDGSILSEDDLARQESQARPQLNLFAMGASPWRSIQSVSGTKAPSNSSEP